MIGPAAPDDAPAITGLLLDARRTAMPWLAEVHSDAETTAFIRDVVLPMDGAGNEEREPDVLLHWRPA